MAVQMHFRPQAFPFQKGLGLLHRLLLDVKGQDPACFSRQAAEEGGIPPLTCGGVNAYRAGADGLAQKFMDQAQRIELHGIASL